MLSEINQEDKHSMVLLIVESLKKKKKKVTPRNRVENLLPGAKCGENREK